MTTEHKIVCIKHIGVFCLSYMAEKLLARADSIQVLKELLKA